MDVSGLLAEDGIRWTVSNQNQITFNRLEDIARVKRFALSSTLFRYDYYSRLMNSDSESRGLKLLANPLYDRSYNTQPIFPIDPNSLASRKGIYYNLAYIDRANQYADTFTATVLRAKQNRTVYEQPNFDYQITQYVFTYLNSWDKLANVGLALSKSASESLSSISSYIYRTNIIASPVDVTQFKTDYIQSIASYYKSKSEAIEQTENDRLTSAIESRLSEFASTFLQPYQSDTQITNSAVYRYWSQIFRFIEDDAPLINLDLISELVEQLDLSSQDSRASISDKLQQYFDLIWQSITNNENN